MNTLREIPTAKSAGTTAKQRELVDVIRRLTAEHEMPPTVREISTEAGTNISDVFQKLNRLRRDGVVTWRPGCARTLRVVGG